MKNGVLQLKDLKEFSFKDWDGKPFLAFCTDIKTASVECPITEESIQTEQVIGYVICQGGAFWRTDTGTHWKYVYRFEDNEHFFNKRLTYRQLSRWLATGKGEFLNTETRYVSSRAFYPEPKSDEEVPSNLLVRTWDSEEWMQPTTKVLEEMK